MFLFQYNVWERMLESLKALHAMSIKRVERQNCDQSKFLAVYAFSCREILSTMKQNDNRNCRFFVQYCVV